MQADDVILCHILAAILDCVIFFYNLVFSAYRVKSSDPKNV